MEYTINTNSYNYCHQQDLRKEGQMKWTREESSYKTEKMLARNGGTNL